MCGIFCLISNTCGEKNTETLLKEFKVFEDLIVRRGPNSLKHEYYPLQNCDILLVSSVLWLQGSEITTQPLKNNNSCLIYNGDLFGGSVDENLRHNLGDTKLFMRVFESTDDIMETLSNIQGPFAFVYLDVKSDVLYFGRDKFGRRSLLAGKHGGQFVVSSVAKKDTKFEFIELPSIGIFSLDRNTKQWRLFPWKRKQKNFPEKLQDLQEFFEAEIHVNQVEFYEKNVFVPPNDTHLQMLESIIKCPLENVFEYLCQTLYTDNILKLEKLLKNSIKKRILTQPKFCQKCYKNYNCNHAITGVLFSGGVDCAILALLANIFVEKERPIDLINVAFEKDGAYNTPDRITGLSTVKELENLCPDRKWNFVEVNITREELDKCRSKHISDLIYPLNSILDDSLGCALWFAARGEAEGYKSPCRTLLVGMGADELFGGYSRHRTAFKSKGWKGLHDILEEDWQNLPHRNLARDDRVVSDHGRQLRTPYLDEDFVDFVQSLNCWEKTFPTNDLAQGIGEKILLRVLAWHLGLKKAAVFKKRALQFGSRIANSKEKGHNVSDRLLK